MATKKTSPKTVVKEPLTQSKTTPKSNPASAKTILPKKAEIVKAVAKKAIPKKITKVKQTALKKEAVDDSSILPIDSNVEDISSYNALSTKKLSDSKLKDKKQTVNNKAIEINQRKEDDFSSKISDLNDVKELNDVKSSADINVLNNVKTSEDINSLNNIYNWSKFYSISPIGNVGQNYFNVLLKMSEIMKENSLTSPNLWTLGYNYNIDLMKKLGKLFGIDYNK